MINGIKKALKKSGFGNFILKVYHYGVGVPRVKLKTLLYNLKDHSKYQKLRFYTDEETFSLLLNEGKSLSRFGDGEMAWICQKARGYFGQDNSEALSRMLKRVLVSQDDNVLIGIPNYYGGVLKTSIKNMSRPEQHSCPNLKMNGFN